MKLGFVLPVEGVVGLQVLDSQGREIDVYEWNLEEGYSLEEIDVSTYSEGSYVLRYRYNLGKFVQRLVVVHGK